MQGRGSGSDMADLNGPMIVRRSPSACYSKPGVHSYNAKRRMKAVSAGFKALNGLRVLLFLLGLCGLGYYGYTLADQYVYQAYQNWAFDQQIAGRSGVTFADYIRESTPFGFLAGASHPETAATTAARSAPQPSAPDEMVRPAHGSLLGRLEIPRLNLSAMVREGVDQKTLSIAVGHVPSTALPGQEGNFAIAAHRDTLFRALKDIKKDDLVTFHSPTGNYIYQVLATKIVKPSDVSVLRSDGGGLIPVEATYGSREPAKLLTMITCYPFYYVGAAPKRFIVEARLVSNDPGTKLPASEARQASSAAAMNAPQPPLRHLESPSRNTAHLHEPHRPKRRFWHKLFHIS